MYKHLSFFEKRFNIPGGKAAWGILEIETPEIGTVFRPCVIAGKAVCVDLETERFVSSRRAAGSPFVKIHKADGIEDEDGINIKSVRKISGGKFVAVYVPEETLAEQYEGKWWTGRKPAGYYPPPSFFYE